MADLAKPLRRRWKSRLLKAALVPTFILLVVGLVVAFTPFSSQTLDRQIQASWRRVTGTEITFRRAVYRLGRGSLELSDVEIEDPVEQRLLTSITRMSVGWRWRPLSPSDLFGIDSVRIVAPTSTRIHLDEKHRLAPDARLESFVRLIHRLEVRSRQMPSRSRLSAVRITDFPLYLYREGTGESRLLLGFRSLDAAFRNEPDGKWSVILTGNLSGDTSSPALKVLVETASRPGDYYFTAVLESFDLATHVHVPMPLHVATGGIVVKGIARMQEGQFVLDESSIRAESVRFSSPSSGFAMPPVSVKMSLRVVAQPQTRRVDATGIDLAMCDSHIKGSATISLASPLDFAVRLDESELAGAFIAWVQNALPAASNDLRIEGGGIAIRGLLAGDERGIDRSRCSGSLDVRDVGLRTVWLSQPVGPVSLKADLTSRSLDVSKIDLEALSHRLYGAIRVAESEGESTGSLAVQASWTAEVQTDRMKELLLPGQFPLIENWGVAGQVLGNGSIRGTWPYAPSPRPAARQAPRSAQETLLHYLTRASQTLQIDGLLRLDRLRIDNPRLPAPIEDLSGTLVMSNRSLECSNLEGKILGSRITVSGQIKDEKGILVLSNPDFNMHLQGDLDLTQAPTLVQTTKRTWLRRLRPHGRLGIDLLARGPMLRPSEISLLGDITASNVSLNLDSPVARGELRDADLALHLFPDRIALDRISGRIGDIVMSTSGTISQEQLDLHFASAGDVANGAKILPWLSRPGWHLGGLARVNAHLAMKLKPEASLLARGGLFSNFLAVVNSPAESGAGSTWRLDQASLDKGFVWDLRGALEAEDCTLWNRAMSQKVTHITGLLEFDRDGLHSDGEGTAQWGQCPGIASMTMTLAPEGYPRFKFDARFPHVVVDEWIEGWGSNLATTETLPLESFSRDTASRPFSAETAHEFKREFVIETAIRSETAAFKKLRLGETSAHFEYAFYGDRTGRLEIDRLDAKLYDGEVHLNMDLIWQGLTRWTMGLRVQDVVCERLLGDLFGGESTVTGKLSGEASVRARSDEPSNWEGEGTCILRDSRFLGNPVFAALGRLLKYRGLEDISFTTMSGEFSVRNGIVRIPNLTFQGALMDLYARGEAGLDGSLDLIVFYKFLGSLKGIPILGQLTKVIDQVGKSILKVHAGGTIQEPNLVVVPFSADDIRIMGFKKVDEGNGPGETAPPPTPSGAESPTTETVEPQPPAEEAGQQGFSRECPRDAKSVRGTRRVSVCP
ncbi:hypothetical protein JW916_03480 [Candidatus Sumerlaeota bacterium]|nr:hypothetical protein [Candidatus Sumerlaeota bacterium]